MTHHSGKIFDLERLAGRHTPLFRVPSTEKAGIIFAFSGEGEDPEKKRISFKIDTAQQVAGACVLFVDVLQAIGQKMGISCDHAISIYRPVAHQVDCRQQVFEPFRVVCDFLIRFPEPWATFFDTRISVSAPFEQSTDMGLFIIHALSGEFETRQTIYQLLFQESHEIQT